MENHEQESTFSTRQFIDQANHAYESGDFLTSISLLEKAIAAGRQIGDAESLASAYSNRGTALASIGNYSAALESYHHAIALLESLGNDDRSKAVTLNQLAQVHSALGKPSEAVELYQRALAIFCSLNEPASQAVALSNLASAYASLGQMRQAEEHYQRALALQESMGDWRSAKTINNLGMLYYLQHDLGKAQDAFQRAIEQLTVVLGDKHPDTLRAKINLAQLLAVRGQESQARAIFDSTLQELTAVLGANHPYVKQLANKGGDTMVIEQGQIKGAFQGFKDRDTVFEFMGGRKWKQAEYKYNYHYAYMPRAKVVQEGGRCILHVEGMSDSVEVLRA